jgi:cytochrome c biogenesis protein CcmG/thiol:disulfide interchange protein DsbE
MGRRHVDDFFRASRYKEKMKKIFLSLPIVLIIIISAFLLIFLLENKDPNKPPSALLNENLPNFKIANLFDEKESVLSNELKNKVTLINFFASWCAPCKAEHPLFFDIKKQNPSLFILGIDMQDETDDAIKFLSDDGNPYDYVGVDKSGFVAIEFGVVGLPETFLIDKSGKIIYKYLGPLTEDIIKNEIQPLL